MFDKLAAKFATSKLGKKVAIKPKIESELSSAQKELNKIDELFDPHVLKCVPQLNETLEQFKTHAHALLSDINNQENINFIAQIVATKIDEIKSIDEFYKFLETSQAINEMKAFGNSIINLDHYEKLADIVSRAKAFSTLPPDQQAVYIDTLQDTKIIDEIEQENKKLDINSIKQKVIDMSRVLGQELGVSEADCNKIIGIFNQLADKYLPIFDKIRCSLVTQLPDFFAFELERVKKIVIAEQHLPTPNREKAALLSRFSAFTLNESTKGKANNISQSEPHLPHKGIKAPS